MIVVGVTAAGDLSAVTVDVERGCACGAKVGQRCAETCADMLARRAEWERTHCGARPTGRVLSRYCWLDGYGVDTHGTDARGGERCWLDKGHAGDHEDIDSLMRWPQSPVEERRAREAALVALVAAVPEGLDPVGWRAAVLGYVDPPAPVRAFELVKKLPAMLQRFVTEWDGRVDPRAVAWRIVNETIDLDMATGRVHAAMVTYARALAPAPKVQPERRRRGGPVVVVDRGEDE